LDGFGEQVCGPTCLKTQLVQPRFRSTSFSDPSACQSDWALLSSPRAHGCQMPTPTPRPRLRTFERAGLSSTIRTPPRTPWTRPGLSLIRSRERCRPEIMMFAQILLWRSFESRRTWGRSRQHLRRSDHAFKRGFRSSCGDMLARNSHLVGGWRSQKLLGLGLQLPEQGGARGKMGAARTGWRQVGGARTSRVASPNGPPPDHQPRPTNPVGREGQGDRCEPQSATRPGKRMSRWRVERHHFLSPGRGLSRGLPGEGWPRPTRVDSRSMVIAATAPIKVACCCDEARSRTWTEVRRTRFVLPGIDPPFGFWWSLTALLTDVRSRTPRRGPGLRDRTASATSRERFELRDLASSSFPLEFECDGIPGRALSQRVALLKRGGNSRGGSRSTGVEGLDVGPPHRTSTPERSSCRSIGRGEHGF